MLEKDIENMLESLGLTLYDIASVRENGETIYRIAVKHPEGVTMEHVVEATKLLSPLLDLEPPVKGEYRLEVTSPGIERKLSKQRHFERSTGELVAVTLQDKTKIRGKLIDVNDGILRIETDAGEQLTCKLGDIAKAKTYFEW